MCFGIISAQQKAASAAFFTHKKKF